MTFCGFHASFVEFELTSLVVIDTDCISSYKSNYHAITITTVPGQRKRKLELAWKPQKVISN
jgi:hypothetical protein